MILVVLLILGLLAILALEVPRLLKEKLWKELAAFLFLWSIASFMALATLLGVELPNPNDLITAIFAPK